MASNVQSPGSMGSSSSCHSLPCKHKEEAILRRVKNGPNKGKLFYGCPRWPDDNCGFFMWEGEEAKVMMMTREIEEAKFEIQKIQKQNEELRGELMTLTEAKRVTEDKIRKLKLKKLKMEDQVHSAVKNEKMAIGALIMSWLFFAIVFVVLVRN